MGTEETIAPETGWAVKKTLISPRAQRGRITRALPLGCAHGSWLFKPLCILQGNRRLPF